MSINQEKLEALKAAFEADEAFAAELKQAIEEKDVEKAIGLVAAKGIEIGAEDFAPDADGKEIDDAELENVAGGYDFEEFTRDLYCFFYFSASIK